MPLVLASGSAYRRQLLEKLGLPFVWRSPDVDETPREGEAPQILARRLARDKARALAGDFPDSWIIGSDQVAVTARGQLLGKPGDHETAVAQLLAASGGTVTFYTALCLHHSGSGHCHEDVDVCQVDFRPLTHQQIERYLHRETPYDCAGSFKSEGLGIALFRAIRGEDPNALVGLPLIRLVSLFEVAGIEVL